MTEHYRLRHLNPEDRCTGALSWALVLHYCCCYLLMNYSETISKKNWWLLQIKFYSCATKMISYLVVIWEWIPYFFQLITQRRFWVTFTNSCSRGRRSVGIFAEFIKNILNWYRRSTVAVNFLWRKCSGWINWWWWITVTDRSWSSWSRVATDMAIVEILPHTTFTTSTRTFRAPSPWIFHVHYFLLQNLFCDGIILLIFSLSHSILWLETSRSEILDFQLTTYKIQSSVENEKNFCIAKIEWQLTKWKDDNNKADITIQSHQQK